MTILSPSRRIFLLYVVQISVTQHSTAGPAAAKLPQSRCSEDPLPQTKHRAADIVCTTYATASEVLRGEVPERRCGRRRRQVKGERAAMHRRMHRWLPRPTSHATRTAVPLDEQMHDIPKRPGRSQTRTIEMSEIVNEYE